MDKEKLNALLDSIYELEGLVHLAINRDDMPPVLPSLIVRKGRELLERAESIAGAAPVSELSQTMEEAVVNIVTEGEEPAHDEDDDDISVEDYGVDVNDEPDHLSDPGVIPVPESDLADPNYDPYVEPELEPRGRLVFSINDRYRFKRGLFNQSDADFNTTLSLVASMDSYEEAEDYFLNELQWDPASSDVADFLDIIKKYFRE